MGQHEVPDKTLSKRAYHWHPEVDGPKRRGYSQAHGGVQSYENSNRGRIKERHRISISP